MRFIGIVLMVVALSGCGATPDIVSTVPTAVYVVQTPMPPSTPVPTLSPGDQAILVQVVEAANVADGSLAQIDSLHTAYLTSSQSLLTINAESVAEIDVLGNQATRLQLTKPPVAWSCANGLAVDATYVAMDAAGQVTSDATRDQQYQKDRVATHLLAQMALQTARAVPQGSFVLPMSDDVQDAIRWAKTLAGYDAACS